MPSCIPELPPPDTGNPFADPISANLVASRLAAASNTAPGPDRIRYNQWKAADPSCEIMAAIFNASVRLKYTPHSWKESTTVLLHKKGPAGNVSNWRPIALSNTLGKLYSACTASRLTDWSSRNGRLSHAQKGFSKFDGCHEHNFVLQSVINDARVQGITAVLALLDLKNAFGSAPHSVIMKALQWAGLDESATALIERLYSGCTTRIRTCEGLTAPITIASGVRQGCPLSPIIFNLTIEPMIRAILAAEEGYSLNGTPVEVLAFADDIALVSNNRNGLQHMLDIASEVATWAGLDFNAAKCASLHIDGKNSRCLPTNYSIQQQHMNALDESDLYRHLGIPTGFKYGSTGMEIVDKMAEDIEKLDKSLLAPWQKIDAVRTFVSPQISFHLKGGRTARKLLGELDRSIKMKVKKWMSLPDRASTEVLYLPHKVGGMNLFPMKTLADVCNVVQAVHLLKSPDPRVVRIARSTLNRTVERRIQASPTHNQTQDYLHGRTDGAFERPFFSHSSAWTRLRMSTRELRKKIPLEWSSSDDGVEAYLDGQRLTPANVERHLKAAIRVYLGTKLAAKPSQGKVFNVASGSSASNHFARSGNFMRFADWRFIFRARLNVVPLRGCLNFGNGPKNCRKCNYRSETLPHVLNHCGTHMLAATKRHDAVLNRLLKTIPQKRNVQVLTNQTVPESGSDLRPDIFIKDDANKTVTIIDVAIPFETSTTAFEQARNRKIEKYAGITKKYEDLGYKCFNNAFIIGALGSYDPANAACIRRLRIPHKYSVLMKRLMVCDVIRWSRDIYIEHVTGIRQFEVREMTPILGHSTN